jgi:hypothetical protein
MIESVCRVAEEIIQEEYYWRFAALCNAPGRTSNTKRYTQRSVQPSC